MYELSTKGEN